MKRIYHYFILSLCLLSMACEGDDKTLVQNYIIQSDVNFEAKGGTGVIEVSTDQLTVLSDQEWCTTEVIGNSVKVTVPQNTGIGGRTALIIIDANGEKLKVPVTQVAPTFIISSTDPLLFFGNSNHPIELQVQSSFEVNIHAEDDWIKYEKQGNTIRFTCTKSDIPLRSTKIKISSGVKIVTLDCQQKCIEGEYTFAYTDANWDDIDLSVTLTKDPNEENTFITKGNLPFSKELKLKYENNKLAFHAGQDLGMGTINGTDYHLFLTLGYGQIIPTWDNKVDYVAPMEKNKKGEYFFEFVDGKNWGRFFATRISISSFSRLPANQDTYVKEEVKMGYVKMTIRKIF